MSDDYNLDNAGSGFVIDEDDEENFENMMNTATAASEEDEDPDISWDNFTSEESIEIDGEVSHPEERADEKEKESKQVEKPIEEEKQEVEEVQEEKIETVVEEPKAEEVKKPLTNLKNVGAEIQKTIDDRVSTADLVIKVIDAYRKLPKDSQQVVTQFVTNGTAKSISEGELFVKAQDADPSLAKSMTLLHEAYNLDKVDRAFYLMDLGPSSLRDLGNLISVFASGDLDSSLKDLEYARILVEEIDKLSQDHIKYVEATESILTIAKD